MSDRACDGCIACCEGWLSARIDGVRIRPGTPCIHCTDSGCGIYERRPQEPCRQFICGWLQEDSPLPRHMRPDRCGVIVVLGREWMGESVIMAFPTGPGIPEDALEWLKTFARQSAKPLLLKEFMFDANGEFEGYKTLGYGPSWFVQAVKTRLIPEDIFKL